MIEDAIYYDLESTLQKYLQTQINFILNNKIIKSGKLLLFKISDYYITFTLKVGTTNKTFEVPFPFKFSNDLNALLFYYTLDCIHKDDIILKLKTEAIKPLKKNKLYNSILEIKLKNATIQTTGST